MSKLNVRSFFEPVKSKGKKIARVHMMYTLVNEVLQRTSLQSTRRTRYKPLYVGFKI
jgi:hypothetical protein